MKYPHTKRFMLVWRHRKLVKVIKKEVYPYYSIRYKDGYIERTYINFSEEPMQESVTEYDTEKELLADLELIVQLKTDIELSEYLCLDFEREKVFKFNVYDKYSSYKEDYYINYTSLFTFLNSIRLDDKDNRKIDPNSPYSRDILFRGDDEIPKDYKWDKGEYEGWLQYRWGDRKNAIVKDPKPKNNNPQKITVQETKTIAEEIEDKYNRLEELERLKIYNEKGNW